MNKILEVKNLKVSFRTSGGTVKAVRDISFDLEKGKTLAIVGESGSGKSVTSKAIMGILAGNSIIEGGEILYDGKDLLKISEEEMCKIRGDRISMIFQDPLSSLNPIVKIGKQITEAMLLKNKGNRKAARRDFNNTLKILKENMIALGDLSKAEIEEKISTFDKFNIEAIKLENSYNNAFYTAQGLIEDITETLFLITNHGKVDLNIALKDFMQRLREIKDPYLTPAYDEKIATFVSQLKSIHVKKGAAIPESVVVLLEDIKSLLEELVKTPKINFFRLGYYMLKNPKEDVTALSVEELNKKTLEYLDRDFMKEFLALEKRALEYSFNRALEQKKLVVKELNSAKSFFAGTLEKNSAEKKCKELSDLVASSIDGLEINKDSVAYTFNTALSSAIHRYFSAVEKNPKEEARFAKQNNKREALIARGKRVDWKVVPALVYDLKELQNGIVKVLDTLIVHYEDYIQSVPEIDFDKRSIALVDYFKEKASQVVYRITKTMAKHKAIKLMMEVGISEPHVRYYQYPFEFSGGMRQRIVIAIALAADPDILICDEPTTALDVTIQSQILELIDKLKKERNLSIIFITHDLGVVANMGDDVAVMYAGKIIEYGTAEDIFYDPRHPYTWALLSSMPDLETTEKLDAIPGTPPNMIYPPKGDAFAARNKYAMKIDFEQEPPRFQVSPTHWACTWLLHPNAPKVALPAIISNRIERMKKSGGSHE